ncbi:helix-turn-helix transcriptional regulator [Chryseobacterium soli]|uniref:helix-turn-helix domain-containing protein n=1 Tax=Chryseobacterium soli TaxID=445961 RepID=UPI002955AED1|nr:helix-turn-helix transcriptional regulator [Chryseobacterium soli]MDV7698163.1 helix-turn-helix transcriptional regulator [Chryseobacterium soli]
MISTKKIIVIFLFLYIKIFPQNSFSEKESVKIDSLIKKNQWDLVHLKLLNENLKFKRISMYPLQYHLLIKLDSASVLYKQGKYLEAKNAVLLSLDQVEINKSNLSVLQYEGLKHIGITRLFYIEKRLGNISQGLKYLNIFSQGMGAVYKKKQIIFYAVAHAELGNYKKSVELLNRHLKDIHLDSKNFLYRSFLKNEEIASTYNTIGDTFIKWYKDTGNEKLLDSAHHHYENAYRIMKSLPDFCVYSKALFMCRRANIELLKKQYKNSLLLYNACEKDSVLMDKNFSREAVWMGKAEIYTFLKKTDSAFYYINKIFNEKLSPKCTYENKLKSYHLLSINYENSNDNKNAYKFAKLSLAEINKKNIQAHSGNNFLGTYEKSEIKYASEEMIKKDRRNTFLLVVLITFIFISTIFYMRYYYNKRKNRIFVEFQKKIEEKSNVPIQPTALEMHENLTVVIEDRVVDRILKNLDMLESKKKFLSNNFKLAGIAKQLDTNTAYLSKIINERKGMSFSEYVNDLRINYLLVELQHNPTFRKYTIQAISEEIGYKSTTTFIKAFKDRINMTPSEYIKNLNN